MHSLPEWITAIGTLLTAGGILFLRKQLQLMKLQIEADHERSRRENSINYLFEWSKGLLRSSSLARRLVEELNEEQTKALANEEEFRIDKKHKDLILGVLSVAPNTGLNEKAHEIVLNKSQVKPAFARIEEFLATVGRRKFLKSLYGELAVTPEGKKWALAIYKKAYPSYHPITRSAVEGILGHEA
jgi:Leukotriene A4 hydrolase, C-terminal